MRIDAKTFNELFLKKKAVGRYGRSKKTVAADGTVFDSAGESKRWTVLCYCASKGEIHDLRRQVRYIFQLNGVPICSYIADFVYRLPDGWEVVEDFKGNILTDTFKIKKKMMKAFYGITFVS